MTVRSAQTARRDLRELVPYVAADNPRAAAQLGQTLRERGDSLADQPLRGRIGSMEGTREVVILPTPYILIYAVEEDRTTILRVMHSARPWPGQA